jgi:hypothetical protein
LDHRRCDPRRLGRDREKNVRTLASRHGPVITRAAMKHFRRSDPRSAVRKCKEDSLGRLAVHPKLRDAPAWEFKTMAQFKELVFSGVQPTGNLISATISAPSSASCPCRTPMTASTAWSTCTRSPCRRTRRTSPARSGR